MSPEDDVTAWLNGLQRADAIAAQQLWQRYYPRLVALAARRLPASMCRAFDEEDVALSAIDSFCRGVTSGRFPDVTDRDSLWALLIVITKRKCRSQVRRQLAAKRGGGRTQGESAFENRGGEGIGGEIAREPTPDFAVLMSDEVSRLLELLSDDITRSLALLKLDGFTNHEAAEQLGCSLTTVERRLRLIRKTWSQ